MKINGFQAQDIYSSYTKQNQAAGTEKSAVTPSAASNQGDKVEISSKSKSASLSEAALLSKKAFSSERQSERAQKIDEIKNKIQNGNYNVSSMDVAKSILKGNLFDQKA